jgi:polysaccharide deacetylase 2 family uncharacterized protein YibQ
MARRRTRRTRRIGLSGLLLFLLLAVVCTVAIYLASRGWIRDVERQRAAFPPSSAPSKDRAPEKTPGGGEPSGRPPREPRHSVESPGAPPSGTEALPALQAAPPDGARIAVVIDDLGRSLTDLTTLGRLGVPLTYAVLPFESRTPEVVRELRRQKREILLHLPMEGSNGANPGPGALTLAMGKREIVRRTRQALAAVPGAVGVNNHMGSVFSADARSLRPVLEVVAERGLFFLDSRTTAETVGFRLAVSLGVPAAERQVFLDRDPDPEAIRGEFRRLLAVARERGSAIAIGHPHRATLDVLAEEIPQAKALGYEIVPVSYLLTRPGELPE